MALSPRERALIQSLWTKISPQTRELGAEVLERLFVSYPETKNFFPNFDLSDGSADLRNHGEKMFNTLGNAVSNLDNLDKTMSTLSHTDKLKMGPKNLKRMSETIQDVMADHFPDDVTPETQTAWGKFLSNVSTVLDTKYR